MRKAQAKERMLFFVGVIVICLIALVIVVRLISPTLESSREAQAKVLANKVAIYVNTLYTMDAGRVDNTFETLEIVRPLIVEIYSKGDTSYVRVTYDEGKYYEVPLLVKIDPVPPIRTDRISVRKDMGGKVYFEAEASPLPNVWSDQGCREPTPEDLRKYISAESARFGVQETLIKSVITQESGGCQCKNCEDGGDYKLSYKGAIGLMQLMPGTAKDLGVNPYEPEQNVIGGAKYLSSQIKAFGDIRLGLAAYNEGPGNLQKQIDQYGKSWDSIRLHAPSQTREYVDNVMAFYNNCYAQRTSQCTLKECKLC